MLRFQVKSSNTCSLAYALDLLSFCLSLKLSWLLTRAGCYLPVRAWYKDSMSLPVYLISSMVGCLKVITKCFAARDLLSTIIFLVPARYSPSIPLKMELPETLSPNSERLMPEPKCTSEIRFSSILRWGLPRILRSMAFRDTSKCLPDTTKRAIYSFRQISLYGNSVPLAFPDYTKPGLSKG